MKAIKVLFAIILTATLGLMTSCSSGGGGGGGSKDDSSNTDNNVSSDLSPNNLVGRTLTCDMTAGASTATIQFRFDTSTTAYRVSADGTLSPFTYTYMKRGSTSARLEIRNVDHVSNNYTCWAYIFDLTFISSDTANADSIQMQKGVKVGGEFSQTDGTTAHNLKVTFQ